MSDEIVPLVFSVNEACKRLCVGRTMLYDLFNSGDIRPIKLGKKTLVPDSEIRNLVERTMRGEPLNL